MAISQTILLQLILAYYSLNLLSTEYTVEYYNLVLIGK